MERRPPRAAPWTVARDAPRRPWSRSATSTACTAATRPWCGRSRARAGAAAGTLSGPHLRSPSRRRAAPGPGAPRPHDPRPEGRGPGRHWASTCSRCCPSPASVAGMLPPEFAAHVLAGRPGRARGRGGRGLPLRPRPERETSATWSGSAAISASTWSRWPPSSTTARRSAAPGSARACSAGDVAGAAALLGRPYLRRRPRWCAGDGRGRTLGIPTANLALVNEIAAPGRACTRAGSRLGGGRARAPRGGQHRPAAHLRRRRTDDRGGPPPGLRGRSLRPDACASSSWPACATSGPSPAADALVAQIQADIAPARRVLAGGLRDGL